MNHAVRLADAPTRETADYELSDLDDSPLTPQRWLELMSTEAEHCITLRLRAKARQPPRPPSVPASAQRSGPPSVSASAHRPGSSHGPYSQRSRSRATVGRSRGKEPETSDRQSSPAGKSVRNDALQVLRYQRPHVNYEKEMEGPPEQRTASADATQASSQARQFDPGHQTTFHPASSVTQDFPNGTERSVAQGFPNGAELAPHAFPLAPLYSGAPRYPPTWESPLGNTETPGAVQIHPAAQDFLNSKPMMQRHFESPRALSSATDKENGGSGPLTVRSSQMGANPRHESSRPWSKQDGNESREAGPVVKWMESSRQGQSDYGDTDAREDKVIMDPSYGRIMPEVVSAYTGSENGEEEKQEPPTNLPGPRARDSFYGGKWQHYGVAKTPPPKKEPHKLNGSTLFPGKQARVRFASSTGGTDGDSDTATAYEEIREQSIPFFKWGLKGEPRLRTMSEIYADFFTVLDEVKKEMANGETKGAYLRTFKCTKSELLCRHGVELAWFDPSTRTKPGHHQGRAGTTRPQFGARGSNPKPPCPVASEPEITGSEEGEFGARDSSPKPRDPAGNEPEAAGSEEGEGHSSESRGRNEELNSAGVSKDNMEKNATGDPTPSETPLDAERISPSSCRQLTSDLFQVSESVMEAFVGDKGDVPAYGQAHDIYMSLWGAMDVVWRVSRPRSLPRVSFHHPLLAYVPTTDTGE